ncbi:acyl carrier protein [Mycolicibacterium farcinogenes]|uniref:acyl carrier protein n=1 Tax=Mycolicibacterium farcinogenes TaxID=1802 RepID=UPI001C8D8408|nr:acyl carrier protein [Mycolicibacterium farcinogenes]QZH59715.1 acyl carrier protein [Mycolicibacterium farcinogenes]
MTSAGGEEIGEVQGVVREEMARVLDLELEEISADAHFYDELDGHSLQKVELFARLEERFGLDFLDTETASLHTLAGCVRLVLSKLDPTEANRA